MLNYICFIFCFLVLRSFQQSIQAAIAYFNRWGNRKDEKWIEDNAAFLQ